MAFSNPVTSPSSGETLVNGLLWGMHWSDGSPATTQIAIYVAGESGNESFDFGGTAVTGNTEPEEAAAFRLAMQVIEAVCNLDFVEVGTKAEADIIVAAVNNADADGALGIGVPPGEDVGPLNAQQGAVIVNWAAYSSNDFSSLQQGGYDFITFIHELGHALGLKHPHDRGGGTYPRFPGVTAPFDDFGDFDLNQGIYTMMSYNDGFPAGPEGQQSPDVTPAYGWQGTPMALDIAALQYLYGANLNHRTGNDIYMMPSANAAGSFYSCIWDAGGTDLIRVGGAGASTVDLRAATVTVEAGGGGFVSSEKGILGGFTIARNVVIENATGGAAADVLTGNAVGNTLKGLGGGDTIKGNGGNDRIDGGAGADILTGGAGRDVFVFSDALHSGTVASDRITDFELGLDRIGLNLIDANAATPGVNNAFDFVGAARFSETAGELRAVYQATTGQTFVLGDIDGDGAADFRIRLAGEHQLSDASFIL